MDFEVSYKKAKSLFDIKKAARVKKRDVLVQNIIRLIVTRDDRVFLIVTS